MARAKDEGVQSVPTTSSPNEIPPVEQLVSTVKAPLSSGPKMGSNDEYQPATYTTSRGNIRTDR